MKYKKYWEKDKDYRNFGILIGFVLLGMTTWLFIKQSPIYVWLLGCSSFLFVTAIFLPKVLSPFYLVWMKLGGTLNWLNTRLLLSIIFFGLFTPISIFRRIFHMDSLHRKLDTHSLTYWLETSPIDQQETMKYQF